jgi:predicted PurR-regulated permease PerM
LLNVVPFVGPAVACPLIALAALLHFQSLEMTSAAGLVSVGVAAFEGNLITPWLTSRAGELNTVAVFVAVLFWGWLWNVSGPADRNPDHRRDKGCSRPHRAAAADW